MTELTDKQRQIIEKVQKLLALSQNNSNEHEAQSAAAMAMDLLSAYNLSMHQVGSKSEDRARKDQKRKGGLYQWQRDLWGAVANLNFCVYFSIKGLEKGSTYEHRLVGSEVNVVSTEVMADYLQQATERMGQAYAKDMGFRSVFVKEAIAYREGIAARLVARLNELRRNRMEADRKAKEQAGANTGNALVLADVIRTETDLNTDYINGYAPGTTAQRRAEREQRQREAMERYEARDAEHQRRMECDPEYRANREKQEAEWAALNAKYQAKRDAAERRRMKNADQPGYDSNGYKIQYRKATPQEARARLSGFHHGYSDGKDINLDQQIDEEQRKGIDKA